MQKSVHRIIAGTVSLSLLVGVSLWLAGCGGGTGGTSVPPAPGGGGGGGTTPSVEAFRALLPAGQAGAATVDDATCNTAGCHASGTKSHTRSFSDTKHAAEGVGCQNCHGPGGKHVNAADADRRATILTFPNTAADGTPNQGILDPIVCGQCHSSAGRQGGDQYDQWIVSKHAERVETPNKSTTYYGAGCPKCHSSLVRTWDLEEGHAGVPDAASNEALVKHTAACATCHDPHDNHAENALEDGDTPNLRHDPHQILGAGGADYTTSVIGPGKTVTEYTSFNHVCATCHNGRGVDGSDAKLGSSTSRPGMHDSPQFNMLMGYGANEVDGNGNAAAPIKRFTAHRDIPEQCIHCHMSQGHAMVAGNQGCSPCHSSTEAATLRQANGRTAVQNEIQSKLQEIQSRLNQWGVAVNLEGKGANSWQYTSTDFGGPTGQAAVPIEIKRARNNYYFVVRDLSLGVHNSAYTRFMLDLADSNLTKAFANAGITSVKSTVKSTAPVGPTAATASKSVPATSRPTLGQRLRNRPRGR